MKVHHFEAIRPVCPACRAQNDEGSPLRIASIAREEFGHVIEGVLHCTNPNCLREFPIVDGIPLLVANIRQYIADNILSICTRRDLNETLESMLGDCTGPGSVFDVTRQHLSSYAWDHYADLDPQEPAGEPRPGSMLRTMKLGLELAGAIPAGPIIDVGCSVGRGTFALAEHSDALVLGVDLNFPMLRVASEILRHGTARYPRRRVGLVYDRREFPAQFANQENVDFWACDVTALPFPAGTFSLAVSMNVLDSVYSPHEMLLTIARILRPGGKLVLSCPYDWSSGVTPLEAWLGGHSQRSPAAGSSTTSLRSLLTPGAHSSSIPGLALTAEKDHIPWHVRLHERSTMTYSSHLLAAVRQELPPDGN